MIYFPDYAVEWQPRRPAAVYLVSGSREFANLGLPRAWARALPVDAHLVHGAARGVDRAAAHEFLLSHPVHQLHDRPADWDRLGRSAGHARNEDMVIELLDLVRQGWRAHVDAFWDQRSPGTRGAIDYALGRGLRVTLHLDNGDIEELAP